MTLSQNQTWPTDRAFNSSATAATESTNSSSDLVPGIGGEQEPLEAFFSYQMEQAKRNAYYIWLYTIVYEVYINGVFFYLLPMALIPLLNFQLLLVIKKRRRETRQISLKKEHRHKKSKATDREDGLTMIVLGITFCFFVCCLIPAVYKVTRIARVPGATEVFLMVMSDTMLCVNASTDFFFYCLLGAKFRNTFIHIFCSRPNCTSNRSPMIHSRNSDTFYHTV